MERKGDVGVGVSEVRSSGGQIVQRVLVSQQGLDFPHFFAPAVRELRHKKENCCTKIQNLRKKNMGNYYTGKCQPNMFVS